ncbi:MAG: AarF/ABC1/UbiB kinase family protein [archaeon]
MSILQTFKDIGRLRQIVNVLFKHELGYLIQKLNLRHHLTLQDRIELRKQNDFPDSLPIHLRKAMEELSGTFIKLGQLLSLRPDLIPKEYAEEFSKLQDNVPSFSFSVVQDIIESEFKKPLNSIFLEFEEEPIAAASVGQVHRAKLKSGQIVAVKVQRPKIDEIFRTDIDLMYRIFSLIEQHYQELQKYNLKQIIKEFEEYTKNELNYLAEANNIQLFYKKFENDKKIKIPRVYFEYTTKRVLTMEFIYGEEISKVKLSAKEKKQAVKIVADCFLRQVLDYGIFHADPHPGNIFITRDKKLALIDFGIVGKISEDLRKKIENLFIALVQGNRILVGDFLIALNIVDDDLNIEEFRDDLSTHLGKYYDLSLSKVDMSSLLYDLLSLARKYNMKFPPNFVLLIKAIATTEGFGKEMDPDFNFVQTCKPYVDKIIDNKTSPEYIMNSLKENMLNFKDLLTDLPSNLKTFLLRKEKVKVDVDDSDIRRFSYYINKSLNRLALGIVIAGLIIGSGLIIQSEVKPIVFNIPLLALICLIIALILFIALLRSIEKEKGGA